MSSRNLKNRKLKHKKHIMIVGKGDGYKFAPPRSNSADYEIWGINDLIAVEDADLGFDMHQLDERWEPSFWSMDNKQVMSHLNGELVGLNKADAKAANERVNLSYGLTRTIKACKEKKIPFLANKAYKFKDNENKSIRGLQVIEYPLLEVINKFGLGRIRPYFTNGIDYMLAYAALHNVEKLEMYGINMALESEYYFEKPGVEFWTGLLIGRGCEVLIHDPFNVSSILRSRDRKLYGSGIWQEGASMLEKQDYQFVVTDRIKLRKVMGEYKGTKPYLDAVRYVKSQIEFSEDEQATMNMSITPDGNTYNWDDKLEVVKTIPMTVMDTEIISNTLKQLEQTNQLPELCLELYDRFVERNGDPIKSGG